MTDPCSAQRDPKAWATDGTSHVNFDTTDISTEGKSTPFEFGGGVIAKVTDKVSVFATGDYTTNLGGDKRRILEGNLGFSVKW